ncbi:RICIN domain-containing protein [Kitasatospora sp. NPDC057940]|uniref:RICIN domain-containing protein n=1 Tax=Kitasatospora sp. NPDC057940 TaxID=3346285 RepID=UPI0036DF6459
MPHPHRPRSRARRPLNALGTVAAAGALLFTASPAALAAPASATALAGDPAGEYPCSAGLYRINTAGAGLPLTVSLDPANHGAVIQYAWDKYSNANQRWRVCRKHTSDGRDLVYFRDGWRDWCMVVDRWGKESGTWIITVGCGDDVPENQAFRMAKVAGTDRFALQNLNSDKWVASQGHSDVSGVQMIQDSGPDLFYLQAV